MNIESEFIELKTKVNTWTLQHDKTSKERNDNITKGIERLESFMVEIKNSVVSKPCETHAEAMRHFEKDMDTQKKNTVWAYRFSLTSLFGFILALLSWFFTGHKGG